MGGAGDTLSLEDVHIAFKGAGYNVVMGSTKMAPVEVDAIAAHSGGTLLVLFDATQKGARVCQKLRQPIWQHPQVRIGKMLRNVHAHACHVIEAGSGRAQEAKTKARETPHVSILECKPPQGQIDRMVELMERAYQQQWSASKFQNEWRQKHPAEGAYFG